MRPNLGKRFARDGFAFFGRIVGDDELAILRETFDHAVANLPARKAGAADHAPDGTIVNIQIKRPEHYFPRLRRLALTIATSELARALLGQDCRLVDGGEFIYRPARVGRVTEWHQDEAFMDPAYDHRRLTVWIPLDDVNDESGCMSFLPGSHLGAIHPHRMRPLPEICGAFDDRAAIAAPLAAGDAIAHHCRTLHRVGANTSAQARRVYLQRYAAPSIRRIVADHRPWLPAA